MQLAYVIGIRDPISIRVDTFGTGVRESFGGPLLVRDWELTRAVWDIFPVKPGEIINHFDLKRPLYADTAAYGHFGREGFPWEQKDKVEELRKYFKP